MFDNYQAYFNKAITGKSTIEMLKAQHEETVNSYAELSKELKDLISKEHNYELAVDLMKKLVEGMSRSQINHLETLINSALSTIFYDRQYSVELVVTELRNTNNLQILLNEVLDDGQVIKTKLEDNGFGVKCVIGFILQVYFIIYYKQYPILFLDEAFTQLSKQYLPYLKSLINDLASKYNFIFVLVTHDRDIMELADRTYLVDKGKVSLYNE
jgi:DNA repair exonuclease SbcCD ATPase subunit